MFKNDDATRSSVCVDIGDEIEGFLLPKQGFGFGH